MKNDLTPTEKNLIKSINFKYGKKFNHTDFMEWSSSREQVEKNLRDGETIYESLGLFAAMKDQE